MCETGTTHQPAGTFQHCVVIITNRTKSFPSKVLLKLKMKLIISCVTISFLLLITIAACKKSGKENKPEWAKKDIRDYSDADLERLLDQWEVRLWKIDYCGVS